MVLPPLHRFLQNRIIYFLVVVLVGDDKQTDGKKMFARNTKTVLDSERALCTKYKFI